MFDVLLKESLWFMAVLEVTWSVEDFFVWSLLLGG